MSGTSVTRVRRLDIQGLRMIAVVGVIANHLLGWPAGGFVGVDIFFVISGFLITGLLAREHERTGRISFVDFYRRRIKRLLPASLLVLAVVVVVATFLLPRPRAVDAIIDAAFAALLSANWRFSAVGTDYFAAGQAPSPVQHFWSLSVEEQFYIVWPGAMVLTLMLASLIWRDARSTRLALLAMTALVSAISLGWAMLETATAPGAAYFSTFSRMWELGVGATLALVVHSTRARIPVRVAPWAGLLGVAGIALSLFVVQPDVGFPAPGALLPVLATALVIWAGVSGSAAYERVNVLLTNRVSQFLGDISYSLYLWHFPVIVFGRALLPPDSLVLLLGAPVVTLVLSWASFRWIEEPVRRSGWLTRAWRWRPRIIVGWAAASVAVLVATVAVSADLSHTAPSDDVRQTEGAEPGEAQVPTAAAETGAPSSTRPAIPSDGSALPIDPDSCFGSAFLANSCSTGDLTGQLTPSLDEMARDTGGAYACWTQKGGELQTCTYGSEAADAPRVALVGDSHAGVLMTGLLPQLDELGWSLDTYVGYGCQWRDGGRPTDCADVLPTIDERVTSGDYDVIITTAARWSTNGATASDYAAVWSDAIDAGTDVVAVGDVPMVPAETIACVQRVGGDPSSCVTPWSAAFDTPDPLVEAVEIEPRAQLVDVLDRFCVEDGCPAVIGDVIVYRDSLGHTTGTYMETLGPELADRIRIAAGL